MLTVWCVCVGDKYTTEDVLILKGMVERNLTRPHIFMCLSDRPRAGVTTYTDFDAWTGWWSKLKLFEVSSGDNLYLDIDTVVTGPLDDLVSEQLSMPKNWALSGHGGWQSSVMSWGRNYGYLALAFDPDKLSEPANGNYGYYGSDRLWGDQEFITHIMGDDVKPMKDIYSYRYHCMGGPPAGAKVACFHGEPKPSEVGEKWVLDARSTQT